MRARRLWTSALIALSLLAMPRAFAQTTVDTQLVLAVDASGSVSQYRFELQKQGYVAALRDPRVLNAIRSGMNGAIAVSMFQWTGARLQAEVIPWMVIRDEETANATSAAVAAVPRRLFGGGTSLSGAIDYAMALFPRGPVAKRRKL